MWASIMDLFVVATQPAQKPTIRNNLQKSLSSAAFGFALLHAPLTADAAISVSSIIGQTKQSPGWDLVREKRTVAIKAMASKGIVKVSTDDSGNQFLALPWLPDKRIPYKSLPLAKRLQNEVCAGAFGEVRKHTIIITYHQQNIITCLLLSYNLYQFQLIYSFS
jgi:hypothetical protein